MNTDRSAGSRPNITWERLDWLRSLSGGLPLVIKGIRNVDDALKCVEQGVDGVVVSNHGGRQFDGGLSSIELLPGIAEAVGDRIEVYFDSGIRSGLDVFKGDGAGRPGGVRGPPHPLGPRLGWRARRPEGARDTWRRARQGTGLQRLHEGHGDPQAPPRGGRIAGLQNQVFG